MKQEIFVSKSRIKHGNTYDYSSVPSELNSSDKIIINCPKHGSYQQIASNHIRGNGCKQCSYDRKTDTLEAFIKKSKQKHGDTYDYSKVVYINNANKVEVICSYHGSFWIIAYDHTCHGYGCKKCKNADRITSYDCDKKDAFIQKAILIHGTKYNYDKAIYVHSLAKLTITCVIHGDFDQLPTVHTNKFRPSGCPKCVGKNRTNQDFIDKLIKIFGDKLDYTDVVYQGVNEYIDIKCNIHGVFTIRCDHLLDGRGCAKCSWQNFGLKIRKTTEQFIVEANKKFPNKYDYSLTEYSKNNEHIIVICKDHNFQFKITPSNFFSGRSGCTKCIPIGYSKSSILWLNFKAFQYDVFVQHALNIGEYKIPNSKYRADGYSAKINTIFEYYGGWYHGDPRFYKPNDVNLLNYKTYGELYSNTIEREKFITKQGYNIVSIWEHDWNNAIKLITKIQKKWKTYLATRDVSNASPGSF